MNPSKKATHRVTRVAAVSALKRFLPRLRSRLYTATQLYSNWIKVYKPCRATPIPWQLVQAMAGVALSVQQRRLAVALLLQFLFFLRTSEIYGLRPRDVSCLQTGHVVVALPHTKTSRGRAQSVSLYDPFLCRVLPSALSQWSPDGPIIDSSLQVFRARFQQLVVVLGLEEGTFLPYGLRRGGATFHWQTCQNFEATMIMGRWADQKTCRIYLDEARALLVQQQLTISALPRLPHFVHQCQALLSKGWR